MCNNIIFSLIMGLMVLEKCSAISPPTVDLEKRLIKKVALKGRERCTIEKHNDILNVLYIFDNCEDKTVNNLQKDFFTEKEYILCVGFYQALYGVCEFFDDKTFSLSKLPDSSSAKSFCNFSHDLYSKLVIDYQNDEMKNWFQFVKESMSNTSICSNLCIFLNKVDPKCTLLLNLINTYNELKYQATTKKSAIINLDMESNMGNQNVENGPFSIQNKNNSSTTFNQETFLSQKKQATLFDQSNRLLPTDVKTENVAKQFVNTAPLNNSGMQLEKETNPTQAVLVKSSKQSETVVNGGKPTPISSTINSIQTEQEQQEREPRIQNIPGNDPELDALDMGPEGIPPSSEKEMLGSLDEENKSIGDRGNDVGSEGSKSGIQLNPNDQEMDILPGYRDRFKEAEDSNFFAYFLVMTGGCIVAYVLFHNRNKLLALALEGRKGRSARTRGGRHSSASYSKLHSNLEEAIASNTTPPSATNVLY